MSSERDPQPSSAAPSPDGTGTASGAADPSGGADGAAGAAGAPAGATGGGPTGAAGPAATDPGGPVEPGGQVGQGEPVGPGEGDGAGGADRAGRDARPGAGRDADRGVGRSRPFAGPRALRKPGRTETRMKDMLGALLILIPIALLIVGVGRTCSFAPAGPTVDPDAGPRVDAPARLAEYARVSTFGLRVPDVPWRSNSTDRGAVEGGGTAVRVGYLTEQGRYLRLVQSDASEEALLRTEGGPGSTGDGVTSAAGLTWVTYRADNGEPIRIATLPGSPTVRLLITGSADDAAFRTLADATLRARPIPPGAATN